MASRLIRFLHVQTGFASLRFVQNNNYLGIMGEDGMSSRATTNLLALQNVVTYCHSEFNPNLTQHDGRMTRFERSLPSVGMTMQFMKEGQEQGRLNLGYGEIFLATPPPDHKYTFCHPDGALAKEGSPYSGDSVIGRITKPARRRQASLIFSRTAVI